VGISESRIRKTLSQTIWTISYITLTFLGIGIVLINIIAGNVLKPLMMLTIGAKEIGSGKYGHRVEVENNYEIGSLAASFNDMSSELHTIIKKLEHEITERKEAEVELKIGLKELEDFYQMAVGRELRMVELKGEIDKLKSELSQYKIAFNILTFNQ
jgi:nitrate/nitrite-specific signal transduction histidine kinase